MTNNFTPHPAHSAIYPGTYEPLPREEQELWEELTRSGVKITRPPVNISEQPACYRIEIPAPGFSREDFSIRVSGHLLSVTAVNRQACRQEGNRYRFHGFHASCIKRDIYLPQYVDSDFVTSEYKNGILTIYLYKNTKPYHDRVGRVMVY